MAMVKVKDFFKNTFGWMFVDALTFLIIIFELLALTIYLFWLFK